jgi:hypothetical protein
MAQDATFVLVEGAHARRFDEEVIVLDLAGGDYYGLNAVGAAIWEGLVAGRTPAQVARELTESHDVDYETALRDCLALIDELCARRLLRKA